MLLGYRQGNSSALAVGPVGRQIYENVGTDAGTEAKFRPMFMRVRHAAQADKSQHVGKLDLNSDIFRLAWAKLVPVFGTGGFAQCSCGDFLCKIPGWDSIKVVLAHCGFGTAESPSAYRGRNRGEIGTKNRYHFFFFPLFSAAVMCY